MGLAVALAGVVFVALAARWLVPARKLAGMEGFFSGAYFTEVRVPKTSKAAGRTLGELEQAFDEAGAQVVGLVRNDVRITPPNRRRQVQAEDILVIEAEAEALGALLASLGLTLEHAQNGTAPRAAQEDRQAEKSGEIQVMELAVLPGSTLAGNSARDIRLRTRYGLNLLAVSRHGTRSINRLRSLALASGDLLLMQGPPEALLGFAADRACVPLADRPLRIPESRKAWQAGIILAVAVGLVAVGALPASIAFGLAVLVSMALRTVSPRVVYEAIDWPVVVLLAALIPVAGAMESTGAADVLARRLLGPLAQGHAGVALGLILVVTTLLTSLVNNAATAAVMCPIALGIAAALEVRPEAFLMAVAIGSSCAFLTPIGHQNNTLILGPGGFRFGDYWRLGLPLSLLVIGVSIPLLLLFWPL